MPTSKHRIAVNLSPGEYSDLATLSETYDVSMSWLGRQAIRDLVARYRGGRLRVPLRIKLPHQASLVAPRRKSATRNGERRGKS